MRANVIVRTVRVFIFVRFVRILYRFLFFSAYTTFVAIRMYIFRRWWGADMSRLMEMRRRWARRLLATTGVKVSVYGEAPAFPCLLLANHRSYLDPILVLRDVHAFPVAKAELARWPVIGRGARQAGIIYLQRGRASSGAAALKAIADVILQEGFSVILFPEGTTSAHNGVLPMKKGAFRAAVRWNLPVVPVAICFFRADDFWVGSESFLRHAWRRFQEKEIAVRVCYGPALYCSDEEALEQRVRTWIEEQIITSKSEHVESQLNSDEKG